MNIETDLNDIYAEVEPHFAFLQSSSLNCPKEIPVKKSLNHLNYRILENPFSLADHVKKIRLIQDEKIESSQLVAALADLFHILKKGGYSLRRRLLNSSRNLVDKEVFETLGASLASGDLSISDEWLARFPTLMVQNPAVEIVRRGGSEGIVERPTGVEDMLALSHEYIENSQLELAIDTLEIAAMEKPLEVEIAELLTELYRRVSDRDRFLAIRRKLKESVDTDLPGCWDEIEGRISQSVTTGEKQE